MPQPYNLLLKTKLQKFSFIISNTIENPFMIWTIIVSTCNVIVCMCCAVGISVQVFQELIYTCALLCYYYHYHIHCNKWADTPTCSNCLERRGLEKLYKTLITLQRDDLAQVSKALHDIYVAHLHSQNAPVSFDWIKGIHLF